MKEAVICHSEAEFREWIENNLNKIGIKRIILSQEVCPDYVVEMENGDIAKIEAELFAINFKYHKHDPKKADYILACYAKEDNVEGVPVIAINKLWYYEQEILKPLTFDSQLSEEELNILGHIYFYGTIEINALFSNEKYLGNNRIYRRIPPDTVKAFPRGTIRDNLFNIISPEAKKYIKKYHHILIAANLSERACSAFESLICKKLIEVRPICLAAALYDGIYIKYDGWVPCEVRISQIAKETHKNKLKDWHLDQIKNN